MFGIGRKRRAHASLYACGGAAIVFPLEGSYVFCELGQAVDIADAELLGRSVTDALHKSRPLRPKHLSLGEQMRAFEDRMEAFRTQEGVGKARFMKTLRSVSISQTPEEIKLSGLRSAQGRFAFEGGGTTQVLTGTAMGQPTAIGQAIAEVLRD